LPRESLGEHQRGPEIGLDVPVPAVAGYGLDLVHLEDRGVVDQTSEGAKRCIGPGDDRLDLGFPGEIGLNHRGAPAELADLRRRRLGFGFRLMKVDGDVPAVPGKGKGDLAAETFRGPGDQSGFHG